MELATLIQEIKSRAGLSLKENLLASWLVEIRSKSDPSTLLKTIIDFVTKKDVDLGSISEKEEYPFAVVNSEFQVLFELRNLSLLIVGSQAPETQALPNH